MLNSDNGGEVKRVKGSIKELYPRKEWEDLFSLLLYEEFGPPPNDVYDNPDYKIDMGEARHLAFFFAETLIYDKYVNDQVANADFIRRVKDKYPPKKAIYNCAYQKVLSKLRGGGNMTVGRTRLGELEWMHIVMDISEWIYGLLTNKQDNNENRNV